MSEKPNSASFPVKYPFVRAKVMASGASSQFIVSFNGKVVIRGWFPCPEIAPSGILIATQTAPLLPGPLPMSSMIQTS